MEQESTTSQMQGSEKSRVVHGKIHYSCRSGSKSTVCTQQAVAYREYESTFLFRSKVRTAHPNREKAIAERSKIAVSSAVFRFLKRFGTFFRFMPVKAYSIRYPIGFTSEIEYAQAKRKMCSAFTPECGQNLSGILQDNVGLIHALRQYFRCGFAGHDQNAGYACI